MHLLCYATRNCNLAVVSDLYGLKALLFGIIAIVTRKVKYFIYNLTLLLLVRALMNWELAKYCIEI